MDNPEKDINIYEEAVNQWGLEPQLDMVVEECAELIQAISKVKRGKKNSLDNLLEEIGDVEIMLQQMRYYFDEEKIDAWKEKKISKLKVMLSKSKDNGNTTTKHA